MSLYDPARGVPIERYAYHVISGAMLNGLRRMDPISERIRRHLRRAEERRFTVAQERGELPTYAELEKSDPGLRRARTMVHRHVPLSLDAPPSEGFREGGDWLADPSLVTIGEQRTRELFEAIALLPERQRRIVMMHYYHDVLARTRSAVG